MSSSSSPGVSAGSGPSWASPPLETLREVTLNPTNETPTTSLRLWDDRFLQLADLVASWSKDPRTKVGAVITSGNRIRSMGFNGFPRYIPDMPNLLNDRVKKNLMTLHAEVNAIMFCESTGDTIYVTKPPCAQCAAQIIQAGILRVVFRRDENMMDDEVWAKSCLTALDMFKVADVEVLAV